MFVHPLTLVRKLKSVFRSDKASVEQNGRILNELQKQNTSDTFTSKLSSEGLSKHKARTYKL